uniref:Uncharacterized protein n=1 Tax=Cucumis melo TaxID=3656 RepID=A0A9I9EIK7_CUCME
MGFNVVFQKADCSQTKRFGTILHKNPSGPLYLQAPVACRWSVTFHFYPPISTTHSRIWPKSTAQFSSSASELSSASFSPPLSPSMKSSATLKLSSITEMPPSALVSTPTGDLISCSAKTKAIGRS